MFSRCRFRIGSKALATGIVGMLAFPAAFAQNVQSPLGDELQFVPNQVIVRLKGEPNKNGAQSPSLRSNSAIGELSRKYKAKSNEKVFKNLPGNASRVTSASRSAKSALENVFILKFSSDTDVREIVDTLRTESNVDYAEPNYIYTTSYTPNDPYFGSFNSWGQGFDDLYGLKKMSMENAWDNSQGNGVVTAVIDTGLDFNHPDIQGQIWINSDEIASNGIDDDNNGYIDDVYGYDFIGESISSPLNPGANPDNDPTDGHGHGTHVSGTISATGNNGAGVIGVAPEAKIMVVKGLDDSGSGVATSLANALIYAADNGAQVINNSWGGYGDSSLIHDALEYAYGQGSVLIAAAGNEDRPAAWPHPSNHPLVISVAAVDQSDVRAGFSNWGAKIDVGAPGTSILSLLAADSGFSQSGNRVVGQNYLEIDGTSMAAPHVSGLAALLLAQNPSLNQEQVRHIITQTADDVMNPGWDAMSGHGRVNAESALNYVGAPPDILVQITSPEPWSAKGHSQEVRGTIVGTNVSHYELAYAHYTPDHQLAFVTITSGTAEGEDQLLSQWDISSLPSALYILRLRAFNTDGRFNESRVMVRVDNQLKPGWAQVISENGHSFGYRINRAIAFEDLDNDGTKEVITFGDFTVNVWNASGQPRPGFPVTLPTPVLAGPTITDLNNDGFKEIVVSVWTDASQAGPVWAFQHDGSIAPGFPAGRPAQNQAPTELFNQAPVIASDLDGDGQIELIYNIKFQQQDPDLNRKGQHWLGVLNADGSSKSGYPLLMDEYHSYDIVHMSAVDMDHDGKKGIIVGVNSPPSQTGFSAYRYLRYYDVNGNVKREFTFDDKVFHFRDFQVADFTRDGNYEIFFSASVRRTTSDESSTQGYLIDRNGNLLPGWPVGYPDIVDTQNGTIAVNLDGDPQLEIVEVVGRNTMMAFETDGSMVNGFPTDVVNKGFPTEFISANIADSSGTVLIGNGTYWEGGLHFYDNLGNEIVDLYKDVDTGFSSPAVSDLDNDGRLEVGINALDGRVYIWELDTPSGVEEPTEWPTLWGDNQRTNVIPTDVEINPWQRTVVFIYGDTQSGQDMFVLGGIDHNYANTVLGRNCDTSNFECSIPIRHLNLLNATTAPWKSGDNYLDWYGPEPAQSTQAMGTPLDWTTNLWPDSWGTKRTVSVDGFGETPLNRWGQHYWMLDVEMDCSKTVNGWFEVKSYISGGPGWEADVDQPGRPWDSGNHFAQCGKLNAFRLGESAPVTIEDL
ncbi:S8 family serine peptidase [Microbulbifer sp. SH-1]|nr:S8 family serine peptidase [Microbulbifer sp. SH-1]